MANSNLNLTELLAQRAEATGVEEGRAPFDFVATDGPKKGETLTFTVRDSMFFTDDDYDELNEISEDNNIEDVAAFWMGDDEWDRFVEAGGTPRMIVLIVQRKAELEQGTDANGRPTRRNRSQRRAAGRKR
ncbi:hypothetical protein BJF89_00965 [Corynebacterium sp. CNJ-954]|jgi:hypothetical protein|uniref:hypothetical protein n=1 Tax=Corynebacterium sp. CNJ-954 TaxID=1904962 RepID=UPI00095DF498|nr:hypothetical protein [Corynebacterium sp. CNJ-954]OLT54834.1 hypothetical protein BJF89_00965 [Corynebacterium sp. CNJ-954]